MLVLEAKNFLRKIKKDLVMAGLSHELFHLSKKLRNKEKCH